MIDIIVPVYNTSEEKLNRCLNSLINQTYKHINIIIVDDGSNLYTRKILDKIKKQDNIMIIHQDNNGVSAARNKGICYSKSEYIAFVDSDDCVSLEYVEHAMRYMKKTDADIVVGGLEYRIGNKSVIHSLEDHRNFIEYTEKQIDFLVRQLLTNKIDEEHKELLDFFMGSPCAKVYKKKLIENIEFPENITVYEDIIYNFLALKRAKKIVIANEVWYTYFQYEVSAIHGFNKSLRNSYLDATKLIKTFLGENEYMSELSFFWIVYTKKYLRNYVCYLNFTNILIECNDMYSEGDMKWLIKHIDINLLSLFDRFLLYLIKKHNHVILSILLWLYNKK